MKRGGPLRTDPEKVRAWRQRSKPLKRGKGFKRKPRKKRPPEGPMTPEQWFLAGLAAAEWTCPVTGDRLTIDNAEVHHVIRKSELRSRRLYDVVWHPDNALAVLAQVHRNHESGGDRILREHLRPENFTFAEELGGWAEVHLERHHPLTNEPRRKAE